MSDLQLPILHRRPDLRRSVLALRPDLVVDGSLQEIPLEAETALVCFVFISQLQGVDNPWRLCQCSHDNTEGAYPLAAIPIRLIGARALARCPILF